VDDIAHITLGPRVVVANQDPRQRKQQVSTENMAMARTLAGSEAWPWFRAQCEAKAAALEKQLVSVAGKHDPRDEDRWRGEIAAYRGLPMLIDKVAQRHEKLKQQQAKEQQ
jgi:hypothetical protein